jgi:endonuclease-8
MPEGPTIRNTADMLRAALVGQRVEHFRSSFKKAAAEDWAGKVTGQVVRAVRAHGKNLFIDFENGWTLYTHMLMWGAWHVYKPGEPWRKEARKARAVIETGAQTAVLFSAPVCELIPESALATHRTSELGPDLLADPFSAADRAVARRRLVAQDDRPLGEAIMDQTVLAGIGNILKSEILFKAGLHPLRRAGSLSDDEFDRLIDVSRDLMRRAYETHGFKQVFLPRPLQQATGKLGYVYGRSGQPCLRCGERIQMLRQGNLERMSFFCPVCQPLDPAHPPAPSEMTPPTPFTNTVRTLEDARKLVLKVGICGILGDPNGKLPTLWDAVAAPNAAHDQSAWSEKIQQVWAWRNELTARYPNEIFYGTIRGGRAVLMSMEKLRELYARQHKPLDQCSGLAQQLFAIIAQGAIPTMPLRQAAGLTDRKSRSKFQRALQELQTTFNIARANRADAEGDLWVPFLDRYPQFAELPRALNAPHMRSQA